MTATANTNPYFEPTDALEVQCGELPTIGSITAQ
jgi:hypothetical protein